MKQYRLAFIWAVLILIVSSIPNFEVPGVDKIFGIDKLAHLSEYFILAFLVFSGEIGYQSLIHRRWKELGIVHSSGKYSVSIRLFIILCFALIDELHQRFIPGRTVEWTDFTADSIGCICGLIISIRRKG
ncbi:MAG: VanZ family protein [bacterium]|nr:VanZ family protein [bacterium]